MKISTFLALFILIALVISCQPKKNHQPISHQSPLSLPKLRLSISQEPPTLDPRKGGDVTSSYMHFLLFEGLTRLNSDGTITPAQAQSIDISSDGLTYTFHLRDTLWSNGDPVTAHDFEYAWKKILDPLFPAPNAHLLYPIKNALAAKQGTLPSDQICIQSIDAHTLLVRLEQPTPYFLDLISFCVFFPVHHRIDQLYPNWDRDAEPHFVSNGPYQLKHWKHENELSLRRNSHYWDQPHIHAEKIHISMIHCPITALQMFEKGKLDLLGSSISPLPADALPTLYQQGKVKKQPVPASTIISFNTLQFPFNNVHIRKAFSAAINRQEIVSHITQMSEPTTTQIIPPLLKQKFHALSPTPPADPESDPQQLLQKGLSELGITFVDLPEIVYYYPATDSHHKIAQAIQAQILITLGIHLKLEKVETKLFLDKLIKRNYAIAQTTWIAQYHDPMSILERFKFKNNPKNYSNWENADYIRLLNQSAFETGAARLALLEQAEALFMNEMPITPIYHWEFSYIVQPYLAHMELSPIGDLCYETVQTPGAEN